MTSNRKKILFRWLKIIVLLYSVLGIAMFYLQDYILFQPTKIYRNIPWKFDIPFQEMDIAINNTDTINLVKFFPKDTTRKGIVLFFHGNRKNIGRYAKFAPNFTKHGYEVWMPDYPGYGKSVGERNEKILYQQAAQLYKLARSKFSKDSIIVYGKSLGTGIAAHLAATQPCKRLILETPYYSIPDLFASYAPIYPTERICSYKIPTNEYLQDIKVPITIFHGTSDWVIRYRSAAKLKAYLKPTDEFVTIQNGTHHNLNGFPLFHQKLDSLLQLR